jgi:hypothetical protein
MKTYNLSAALVSVGLLMAVPAFAQTTPAQKQPTQDGADSAFGHYDDAKLKQKTQDGADSAFGRYDDLKSR